MKRDPARCGAVMTKFMALDIKDRLPLDVTVHLLFCRQCRTQVRLLTLAERQAARPVCDPVPLDDELLQRIVSNLGLGDGSQTKHVSMKKWVVAGILMIAALMVFPLVNISAAGSSILTIAFYIFFGCAVTVYCALFIGSNMDFFVKQVKTIRPRFF